MSEKKEVKDEKLEEVNGGWFGTPTSQNDLRKLKVSVTMTDTKVTNEVNRDTCNSSEVTNKDK